MRAFPSRCTALATLALMALADQANAQSSQLPDLSLTDLMKVHVERVFGASERLQQVTEAPASVTIVTAADIKRFGYRTVADILRSVRGFYVSNDRNYSYVGARGFAKAGDYSTRILLLVNGHRVNDNVYDQASVGSEFGLDVATIERVEVIRGPASSLYGTNAVFGVVNVITRTGQSLDGATLQLDAGTLDTHRASQVDGSSGIAATVSDAHGARHPPRARRNGNSGRRRIARHSGRSVAQASPSARTQLRRHGGAPPRQGHGTSPPARPGRRHSAIPSTRVTNFRAAAWDSRSCGDS